VSRPNEGTLGKPSVVRLLLTITVPCVIVGTAFGYWAGHVPATRHATPPPDDSTSMPAAEPRNVVVVGPSTARLADDDRAALRALVREEIAASRPHADAPGADRAPTPAEATLTDAQIQAFDRARAAVDSGIAQGTWTPENRIELRMTMAQLPAETTMEIVRPLLIAMNEGKVRWEGHGPPL
jgi:hypothetical protein